jgi:hypothetical protein
MCALDLLSAVAAQTHHSQNQTVSAATLYVGDWLGRFSEIKAVVNMWRGNSTTNLGGNT